MEESVLLEKANNTKSYHTIVKRKVESEIKDQIVSFKAEHEITAGIRLIEDYQRYYPNDNNLAAVVLGFTGADSQGLSGLEKQYDEELIARGIPQERIRHYGFAFCGKQILIGTDKEQKNIENH